MDNLQLKCTKIQNTTKNTILLFTTNIFYLTYRKEYCLIISSKPKELCTSLLILKTDRLYK